MELSLTDILLVSGSAEAMAPAARASVQAGGRAGVRAASKEGNRQGADA